MSLAENAPAAGAENADGDKMVDENGLVGVQLQLHVKHSINKNVKIRAYVYQLVSFAVK